MRNWLVTCLICSGWMLASGTAAADEEDVFKRLDANEDGFVTSEEAGEEHGRLFRRLLRTSDKDEDGKLSRDEFVAGTTRRPDAASGAPERGQGERPQFNFEQVISRLDKNGDKKISKEEAPERMQQNFDRIDGNSDGFIDAAEFGRIAAAFGGRRDRPEGQPDAARLAQMAERMFDERDANDDGRVSVDEIPEERREAFRKAVGELFDVTPEKGLTKEQFTKVLGQVIRQGRPNTDRPNTDRPQGRPGPEALLERIKEADANNDGKLSREEAPERMKQFFDRLDGNSDGFIDEAEVKAMVQRFRDAAPNNRERPQQRRPRPDSE